MKVINWKDYFPILDYYDRVIMPRGGRFKEKKHRLRVCPLHPDHDPSMGVIDSAKKGEIFHCFGCNAYGDVIELHRRARLKLDGVMLDREWSKKELCGIFGIKYEDLPNENEITDEDIKDSYLKRQEAMRVAMTKFDIGDYRDNIMYGKFLGKDIDYYNSLLVRSIESNFK